MNILNFAMVTSLLSTLKTKQSKGQASLVGAFVGVMVIVLIGVSAILPTVQTSLTAADFNGSLATITDNIPLFIGIALLLVVVGLFGAGSFRRGR